MELSKGDGIELLYNAIPYPNQIKKINLDNPNHIYFDWRGNSYKFDLENRTVNEISGKIMLGSNLAMLMTQCIKLYLLFPNDEV